jgi:Kef-type K+ transport system membrane component KefB
LDPVARLGLAIAVILAGAKVGGHFAVRLRQPAVLGELLAGVVLGSIPLPYLAALRSDPAVDMLARLGVLILLFEVGLESTVRDVLRVGVASVRVAVLGSLGTLALGYAAALLALPDAGPLARLFVAAALTATSIGISARVLRDADASRRNESSIILAASVIDDVLGLLALAVLSGAATHVSAGKAVTGWSVAWLAARTVGFLALAVLLGVKFSPALFRLTARLQTHGALVATALSFCFVLAWASNAIGLAPIVGAFTAGLVLEESHSAGFVQRGERPLAERLEPISSWLVPIFFVMIGMRADFRALARPTPLLLTLLLTAAAIGGKFACALGAPRRADRWAIAFGMMPRGEVTLVFANLGLSLSLLDSATYSALVGVVILTSVSTPLALRGRLFPLPRHA